MKGQIYHMKLKFLNFLKSNWMICSEGMIQNITCETENNCKLNFLTIHRNIKFETSAFRKERFTNLGMKINSLSLIVIKITSFHV